MTEHLKQMRANLAHLKHMTGPTRLSATPAAALAAIRLLIENQSLILGIHETLTRNLEQLRADVTTDFTALRKRLGERNQDL